MTAKANNEPVLDKPGAGLPLVEWAVAKYIMLPRMCKSRNKQMAIDAFARESTKILAAVRGVEPKMWSERRLIPRLTGLEDSSRYWSIAMTLEHLVIVGDLMRELIVQLSRGGTTLKPLGTADVKPDPGVDAVTALENFERMSDRFLQDSGEADLEAFPKVTQPHPWFGPLSAHQWLVIAGLHENIHRKQIKEIIARF